MTDDWVSLLIEMPYSEALALRAFLRGQAGFADMDYTEMGRPDGARVQWGPCDARVPVAYEENS